MNVSTSRILDLIADACHRVKHGDPDGAMWTWFHCFTAEERLAFDLFLVKMNDELAYRAGSPESRFRERIRRMTATDLT